MITDSCKALPSVTPEAFRKKYLAGLGKNSFSWHRTDNWATYRFGPTGANVVTPDVHSEFIEFVLDNTDSLAETESLFSDVTSREILHELLQFKSLGHLHVKLRRNTADYQRFIACVDTSPIGASILKQNVLPYGPFMLHLYHIHDWNVNLLATSGFLVTILHNKQYQFDRDGIAIKPSANDTVLDCGACRGDTSIGFASMVGSEGRIHAFEFVYQTIFFCLIRTLN